MVGEVAEIEAGGCSVVIHADVAYARHVLEVVGSQAETFEASRRVCVVLQGFEEYAEVVGNLFAFFDFDGFAVAEVVV